jgi:protein dithiol:quinone oxidoreductase
MNPLRWSLRAAYLTGFAICLALLGYALYAEVRLGLEPCPLCIFQRLAFVWMALWFLAGGLHAPRGGGRRVYAALVVLGALAGIGVAARQLWLQSLPPDLVPACGPGLDYMLKAFPLGQVITLVLRGSGDCARVDWRFLGLSMAGWTLVWYVLLGIWVMLPRPRGRDAGALRTLA